MGPLLYVVSCMPWASLIRKLDGGGTKMPTSPNRNVFSESPTEIGLNNEFPPTSNVLCTIIHALGGQMSILVINSRPILVNSDIVPLFWNNRLLFYPLFGPFHCLRFKKPYFHKLKTKNFGRKKFRRKYSPKFFLPKFGKVRRNFFRQNFWFLMYAYLKRICLYFHPFQGRPHISVRHQGAPLRCALCNKLFLLERAIHFFLVRTNFVRKLSPKFNKGRRPMSKTNNR